MRFESNGYNVPTSVLETDYVDCVKFMAHVKNGSTERITHETASSKTHYEKKNFFSRKRALSIRESYDLTLTEMKEEIVNYIDRQFKLTEIRKSEDEITDGLPDSLDNL